MLTLCVCSRAGVCVSAFFWLHQMFVQSSAVVIGFVRNAKDFQFIYFVDMLTQHTDDMQIRCILRICINIHLLVRSP